VIEAGELEEVVVGYAAKKSDSLTGAISSKTKVSTFQDSQMPPRCFREDRPLYQQCKPESGINARVYPEGSLFLPGR
jgi:hypothetical protein